MTWLFLNLLLAAPFFAIWVGVPLWLVLKHPDEDHQPQAASGPAHSHRVEPLTRSSRSSPDAASTRPAQTGRARSRTALDSGRTRSTRRRHRDRTALRTGDAAFDQAWAQDAPLTVRALRPGPARSHGN
jgi:hypothetical protein